MPKELKNFNLNRLFFFPLIVTIVITFLLSVVLYYYTSDNFKDIYKKNNEFYSQSYAHTVEQNHQLETHIINDLSEKLVSVAKIVIKNRDLLSNNYLQDLSEITGVHNIWWFTPDGEVIYDNTNTFIGWTPTPDDPIYDFMQSDEDLYIEGIRLSTEGDVYYMVVYARDDDGYFVETALNADYVVQLTADLSYESIVQKIVVENTNIEFAYVINSDQDVIADTRQFIQSNTTFDDDIFNAVFSGETYTHDVLYTQENHEVLEVLVPVYRDGEVETILAISYTLQFYREMNNTLTIAITLIGVASIFAFGILEVIQVIIPLRMLDKSLTSFDIKSGVYKKPKKKMVVFKNMFLSLDKLANRIKEANDENIVLNNEISMLAFTDFLTKLPNRLYLTQKIEEHVENKVKFAVLFIDLDDFKNHNDTKGHVYGDKILIEVGKKLSTGKYKNLFVSRYGGDEFVILLPFENNNEIEDTMSKIYDDFHTQITVDEDEFVLDLSIGISIYPENGDTTSELIRKADIAMYESKSTGKRKYTYYKDYMSDILQSDADIVQEIRKALRHDGFKIKLQPQIDMKTGQIVSYEALARIINADITPVNFIKVAEKTHLINSIGRVIIQKSIEALKMFQLEDIPLKTIYVNFSVHQFEDEELLKYIKDLLDENNIDYSLFGIEITESVLIDKEDKALEFLKKVNEIGFKLALDDFGSGQAGLDYLTKYQLEVVKLDRSIAVKYLNEEKLEVYNTIIKLAKLLNFNVLAEGIETEEQIKLLRLTDCHIVQGYFYYKPMDITDVIILNKNQNLV